jgi:translation initiation factor 5B
MTNDMKIRETKVSNLHAEDMKIRQPIVTVCGHVDHGKTSILDCFRGTCVQEGEKGGITQKISFTLYPMNQLKMACPLIDKSGIKLNIPGFLLIDTPGHAAFTNLRKRGGSLADLAILVIDINEGIKPQTAEVIQILKLNKTPFLIALNKIDNISGWRKNTDKPLKESIESQAMNVKQTFDERYMTLIGALNSYGFDSDIYYNITDFTKKIALVPCSARTQEGIPELVMMLCGISQKYLSDKLKLGKEPRGVLLEIKKEKSTNYIEAILYDGELKKSDEIAIANFNIEKDPIITKIRILEEIEPLCPKFRPKDSVHASTGIRMQLVEKEEVLPGMPFEIYKNNMKELKEKFTKEISEKIQTKQNGIIAKADSLGSLEALLFLLENQKIPVVKVGIGNISKSDVINAKANIEINELDAIIVGFNVLIEEDAQELIRDQGTKIKVITEEVVYKLIENLVDWRLEKQRAMEKKRLMELTTICKLKILHQYVFRNTNPAIFGVKVEGGKLKQQISFIDEKGEKVGKIKNIQSEKKSIQEANEGMEVAVSMSGINFERVMKDRNFIYSDLGESQFRNFKKNKDLLSGSEMKILQEIAEIKRKEKADWGM